MHGVDKEVTVCIDVHAGNFSLGREHHDSSHRFRCCIITAISHRKRRNVECQQKTNREKNQYWLHSHVTLTEE